MPKVAEDRMRYIFGVVNEFVKFAEAKNLGLIVASTGILTVYFSSNVYHDYSSGRIFYMGINFVVFQFITLILSASSFASRTIVDSKLYGHRNDIGDNVIFFGHISGKSEKEYLQYFLKETEIDDDSKFLQDLSHQIVVNSRIASRKFKIFNISLWTFVASFITPIGAFLLLNFYLDEAI